jgi:RNA-binding protein YlmH
MEFKDLLTSRIKELSLKASNNSYITKLDFLSLSEQNIFYDILKEEKLNKVPSKINDSTYLFFGGLDYLERKMLFFLPSYISKEDFINEYALDYISCIKISPKNIKFSDTLTHRDYLGALMNLGFTREKFGDILTDSSYAYLFVDSSISSQICSQLTKVKHTDIKCEIISCKDCNFTYNFIEKTIFIASNRLDNILAEVYNLSRNQAQEIIKDELVYIDGKTIISNSFEVKNDSRISVSKKGKFIFTGSNSTSRSGKLVCKVKIYN